MNERNGGVTRGGFLPSAGEVALTFTGLDVKLCSGPTASRGLLSHWPTYPHESTGPVEFKDFSFFGSDRRRRAHNAATGSFFKIKKNSGSKPMAPLQDIGSSQSPTSFWKGRCSTAHCNCDCGAAASARRLNWPASLPIVFSAHQALPSFSCQDVTYASK